jgi:hypothetical protein
MQSSAIEIQIINDNSLFFTHNKKKIPTRKWREIENIKAQQRLSKELREIDQSFVFCLSDLV